MFTYPLTHAQRGVFTECMRYPDSLHYGLPTITYLDKSIDVEKVAEANTKIINTFSNYNVRLVWENGEIRQTLREERDFNITRVSCKDSEVDDYVKQILRPFDVFNERLVRVLLLETETAYVFLHNFHHLIADGITMTPVYTGALSAFYNDDIEPVEKYSIFDYAMEQDAWDKSPEYEKSVKFYKERFSGKTFTPFPTRNPSSPVGHALLERIDIPRGMVSEFVKQMGIRPNFLLEAAYNITLSAYTRSDSVSYLTLLHGRNSRPARAAHGMFISTIPVGIDINPDTPVIEFVRQFKAEMFNVVRNSNFSLMDFLRINGSLPDTMYAYQGPEMLEKVNLGGKDYSIKQIRIADNTTASFSVVVYETEDAYQLRIECSDAFMSREDMHRFGNAMKACVESIVKTPDSPVRDIKVVTDEESMQLQAASSTMLNSLPAPSIIPLIPNGGGNAVVDNSGTLTYDELLLQARNVACHLVKGGVRTGDFVAVETDRNKEFVFAVLGVMMAGAAYVPIDVTYPKERIDFMVEDSKAVMTLSAEIIESWKNESILDITLPEITPGMKAYMIYTSGSTGTPKGVIISHGALASFVASITQVLGVSSADRIACHSSFSFDASVEDLYPVLLAGGTLYVVPERLRRDISGLAEWLNVNKITGGNYTTRFGQLLLAAEDLPYLRYLVVGGEKMTTWPERNRHIKVINTYGPTECTVDASYYPLDENTDLSDIPIGRPMPGVRAFVCDHHGRLLPSGAEGELWLAGTQLADGYWQRDELTSRYFVTAADGCRCYRTGDIVRWDDDSQLVYLHRDDGQVKVNGYRIELTDIEAQLVGYPDVLEAKVIVVKQATETLCAYYTTSTDVDEASLKAYIAKRLPAYMVPSIFIRMDCMPVNMVGKLDVSRLPKPEISVAETCEDIDDGDLQPMTPHEQLLLDIVRDVTGFANLRVTDSLAAFGLTSMQMIQVAVEAGKAGVRVKMENVMVSSSIRDILSGDESMKYCWINQDKTEDVDVLFCGTTSLGQMRDFAKRQERSILLFVPVMDDEGLSLDALIHEYVTLIDSQLAGKRVRSFVGHSFGGEIAYRVACEWNKAVSYCPALVLIDTTYDLPKADELVPVEAVQKYFASMPKEVGLFWTEYYRKALLASRLHEESSLVGYEGNITLFNALQRDRMFLDLIPYVQEFVDSESLDEWKNYMHEKAVQNADDWRQTHSQISVIDVDDDHYGILNVVHI